MIATDSREPLRHPVTGRPLDVLEIASQQVSGIIGVYPSEARAPQRLELSIAMHLDTSVAAREPGLRHSIDYARLAGEIRFLIAHGRFRTIETAAHAIARWVLIPASQDVPHAEVVAVDVKLAKPGALGGAVAGIPTLQIRRFAADQQWVVEEKPWGRVDIVHEYRHGARGSCGIYRLRVAPGSAIPTHVHRRMEEAELVLGSELRLQRRPVRAGEGFAWPRDLPHRWDNPSDVEQSILCIDRPAFDPADEIEVADPAGGLVSLEGYAYYPAENGLEIVENER